MNSQSDNLKGTFNSSVGKVKKIAGQVTDDKNLENTGLAQENKGKGQKMVGAIKEKVQKSSRAMREAIEKVGRKIQIKGYGKVGRKIDKMSNKLENMAD